MAGIEKNGFKPGFANINKGKLQKTDEAKTEKCAIKQRDEHVVKEQETRPQDKPQIAAGDVLNFMAQSSIYTKVAATKQINPAKFVSPSQKADISKSMEKFQANFESYFNSIVSEVPGISEKSAMALAAKMVEDEMN